MSKEFTKDDVIQNKKEAIKALNRMLEHFINDSSEEHLKKAHLISSWIRTYTNMINFEENFNPTRNISYKRGDILFVDFGFGVGSEFGGKHYAVVLDKHNYHNAASITVIPLSSLNTGKAIYKRDIFLGNELYEKLALKLRSNLQESRRQQEENQRLLGTLEKILHLSDADLSGSGISELEDKISQNSADMDKYVTALEQLRDEIVLLKTGSIAKIEQIRTISKIRICNPKNKWQPLYGIKFSKETMKKINEKIKELYIFDE